MDNDIIHCEDLVPDTLARAGELALMETRSVLYLDQSAGWFVVVSCASPKLVVTKTLAR